MDSWSASLISSTICASLGSFFMAHMMSVQWRRVEALEISQLRDLMEWSPRATNECNSPTSDSVGPSGFRECIRDLIDDLRLATVDHARAKAVARLLTSTATVKPPDDDDALVDRHRPRPASARVDDHEHLARST